MNANNMNAPSQSQPDQDKSSLEVDKLLKDLRSSRRKSAIERLKSLDRAWLVKLLTKSLADPDPQKRALAVQSLILVDARETLDIVLQMLKDPDIDVRWEVCYWITDYGDSRAIEPLIKVLLEDPSPDVRSQAAIALGASHSPKAKPALIQAKDHDFEKNFHDSNVSECAADALEAIERK